MHSKRTPRAAQDDPILRREVQEIQRLKKRATTYGKKVLNDVIAIGKRLERIKDRVGHGNWLPWLRQNFEWSGDTATNYVNIYKLSQTPKFRRLRDLVPLECLYVLARKSEEVRDEIINRAEAGKTFTISAIRRVVEPVRTITPAFVTHDDDNVEPAPRRQLDQMGRRQVANIVAGPYNPSTSLFSDADQGQLESLIDQAARAEERNSIDAALAAPLEKAGQKLLTLAARMRARAH
jgi:hypothetical protein